MKNLFKSFVVLLAVMAAVPSFAQKANNTLTEKEKKQGWTLLFNGKDFTSYSTKTSLVYIQTWAGNRNISLLTPPYIMHVPTSA